jgi:hypothetical protein
MATAWQTYPIEFRGGLISNQSLLQQGTNFVGSATILQNFEVNKEGGYSKIKGYEKYSDSALPGSGPVLGVKVINSGKVLAARKDDVNTRTQWYISSGGAWASLAPAVFVGNRARHTSFKLGADAKVVIVDGVNYPAVFDTSTDSLTYMTSANSPDVQGVEHVAFFKGTAFYAKDNILYFTAPLSVDDFSAANGAGTINVTHDVTGLVVFRDQLIVFTENTIQRITGSSAADFNMSPITDRIGCVSADTIQEVGGDIMYVAPDGIRLLSATDRIGDFGLDIASDVIAKDVSKFLSNSSVYTSVLFREKAQYRIMSYLGSEQPETAKGLIATKLSSQGASSINWSTTFGIKAYVADSVYASDKETVCFANNDGYVYELGTGSSFDGSIIEAVYESPYMPLGDPQIRKTMHRMTLYAEPSGLMDISLNVKYDFNTGTNAGVIQPPTVVVSSEGDSVSIFGATASAFGTGTYGGVLDTVYGRHMVGSGRTVALRMEDISTNPSFTLDTVVLEYKINDRQ